MSKFAEKLKTMVCLCNQNGQGIVEFALVCAFCAVIGYAAQTSGILSVLDESYSKSADAAFASPDIVAGQTKVSGTVEAKESAIGGSVSGTVTNTGDGEDTGTNTGEGSSNGNTGNEGGNSGNGSTGNESGNSEGSTTPGIVIGGETDTDDPDTTYTYPALAFATSYDDAIAKIHEAYLAAKADPNNTQANNQWETAKIAAKYLKEQWSDRIVYNKSNGQEAFSDSAVASIVSSLENDPLFWQKYSSSGDHNYWIAEFLYACTNWTMEADDYTAKAWILEKMNTTLAENGGYQLAAAKTIIANNSALQAEFTDPDTQAQYIKSIYQDPDNIRSWNVGLGYWYLKRAKPWDVSSSADFETRKSEVENWIVSSAVVLTSVTNNVLNKGDIIKDGDNYYVVLNPGTYDFTYNSFATQAGWGNFKMITGVYHGSDYTWQHSDGKTYYQNLDSGDIVIADNGDAYVMTSYGTWVVYPITESNAYKLNL